MTATNGAIGAGKYSSSTALYAYPLTGSGWGSKFANPSYVGSFVNDIVFSDANDLVMMQTPKVWSWSSSTGFGSVFSAPGTGAGAGQNGVTITHAKDAVATASKYSTTVTAWAWSGSGFGSKFSDPATSPNRGYSAAFTQAGDALATGCRYNGYIMAWAWSGSGFGTKFSDPSPHTDGGRDVNFTNAGNAVVVGGVNNGPYAYHWSSSGFGVKFSNPATGAIAHCRGCRFDKNGAFIAVSGSSSPFIEVYAWSGSGWGSKYTDPVSLPPSGSNYHNRFTSGVDAIGCNSYASPFSATYPWASGFGTKFTAPSDPAFQGRGGFALGSDAAPPSGKLFQQSLLEGLGSGGPFFQNPLG